ncbi:uncharacterized protein LOC111621162 isoform X2 [Centruroides sculpturatus]|uniref:uncharacterized protein LOC111621162 isoform X2 n=1 Tax=Centruroides sculpturatus TaxID=218467 RepID=UPI000C6EFC0D|nr:uncharacterized protein LOC111621162 isoform X2 [Centruroides sculpturatus]
MINENSGYSSQEIFPSSSLLDEDRQFCAMDIIENFIYSLGLRTPCISDMLQNSSFYRYSSRENSTTFDILLRRIKRNIKNIGKHNFIMSENIDGHRGEEDVDSLLKFINSYDHTVKTKQTNGTTADQICSLAGKHSMDNEVCRKKEGHPSKYKMKTPKNCNKKKSNPTKSKKKNKIRYDNRTQENTTEKFVQVVSVPEEGGSSQHFTVSKSNHATESRISPEYCEFTGQENLEDNEFRVVMKKHCKRYPLKKTNANRYYNGNSAAAYKNRNQHDGYYARPKETSVVSSSVDDLDLHYAHCSSVNGSLSFQSCSNFDSSLQVSYADIARNSIAPTSKVYCSNLYRATFYSSIDKNKHAVTFLQENSENVKNQFVNHKEPLEVVPSKSKIDYDNCKLSVNVQPEVISNHEQCINSDTSSDLKIEDSMLKTDEKSAIYNIDIDKTLLSKSKVIVNNPENNNCHAEKACIRERKKNAPVIIMDNYLPTKKICDVSFGIDSDELLQIINGKCTKEQAKQDINLYISSMKSQKNEREKSLELSSSSVTGTVEEIEKDNGQKSDRYSSSSSIVSLSNDTLEKDGNNACTPESKLVLLKSGQLLHWKDVDTDKESFNFHHIVQFLKKCE